MRLSNAISMNKYSGSLPQWLLVFSLFITLLSFINVVSALPVDPVDPVEPSTEDPEITDLLILDIHQALPNFNAKDSKTDESSSTSLGSIKIGLFGNVVPKTVENFKKLAPIYQDTRTLFHRVIPNFVIQAGDIDGSGGHSIFGEKGMTAPKGSNPKDFGPYYSGLEDENFILSHSKAGRVSVANAGKNTGGSQFFICLSPQTGLDGKHVVFGQVLKGLDLAEKIAAVERDSSDKPKQDIFIKTAHSEPYKADTNININTDTTSTTDKSASAYSEDHPDGLGGSYHHYVFLPFTVFFSIAGLMAYKNRRSVSLLIRGPRYRRVSGINV